MFARLARFPLPVHVVAAAAALAISGTAPTSAQQAPNRPTGTVEVPTAEIKAPPPEGVLAGRITDATTKGPLARARVRLSADCEAPSTTDKPCTKVLEHDRVALTDEQGRFRFAQLPPGTTYVIRASRTGFAPQAFGELPPGLLPRLIPLKANETFESINIELSPEVVLAGQVLDEDGRPFDGALVEALRATYVDGRRQLVTIAETTSNDRGEFRLSQMPPGQYYVSAMDPNFAGVGDALGPLFYPQTYYPDAATPEDATRITLDPNVRQEAIVIKLRIVRPARVGGRLVSYQELTAGAIELGPRLADQNMSLSNHQVDIKPDGTYQFANVSPGRYAIRARGEAPTLPQSLFGLYTLEVVGVDRTNVDIAMAPGAILSGFVEWEGRARKPRDKSTIVIRAPLQDGSLSGDAVTGNLQPDDSFRLRGVMQGFHYIRPEGLPPEWALKRVEIKGADVTDIPVEFTYGQEENSLRVILTDVLSDIGGSIRVGTRDVLHGYAVVAFSVNPTTWFPRSRHTAITRPNLQGRFYLRGLPGGEYYLIATRDVDEGDIGNPKALQKLADTPGVVRVAVQEGERKLFDLRAVVKQPSSATP